MKNLKEFIKRHQLISFFVLTYAFSWAIWLIFQPIYLEGGIIAVPIIMVGIFGPALVSIILSAVIQPGEKQGNRKAALIAFVSVWIVALLLFAGDQILNEEESISPLLVVVSAAAALLPALVLSMALYSGPGVRHHLATIVKPRGAKVYYFLALLLFPAIWGTGILITRTLGGDIPEPTYPFAGFGLVAAILLDFLYTFFIYRFFRGAWMARIRIAATSSPV